MVMAQTAQNGRAQNRSTTFGLECSVAIEIRAPASSVWKLLTNAKDMPRWNSTVTSLEGEIALGQALKLRVPISERTFTPKVTELTEPSRMVWSDGFAPMFKGVRTFTLTEHEGTTTFSMVEVFAGLMIPMIKGSLPDFAPAFERYAADLKREAES
jgi:uncharacterized protein YndB with AHSA1/START domain